MGRLSQLTPDPPPPSRCSAVRLQRPQARGPQGLAWSRSRIGSDRQDRWLEGGTVLLGIARSPFVARRHQVDVGIVSPFRRRAGADFDEYGTATAAVDQAMAVHHAGRPRRRVTGPEGNFAAILAQNHLAFEHIDKLIFVFMPVTLRRGGARLERADVDAELCQASGATDPFAFAPFHRLVERWRITRRAIKGHIVDVDLWHLFPRGS